MVFFWCKFGFGKCLDDKESAYNAGGLHLIPTSEDPLENGMAIHPAFLPGEFHGQRSLVDWSLWSYKELDMTEHLTHFSTSQSSHWAGELMLSSWAISHVVVRGSASMTALTWSLFNFPWPTTTNLIFKAINSFAKLLQPPLHCMFIGSSWAKCIVDVQSCLCWFMTYFELE